MREMREMENSMLLCIVSDDEVGPQAEARSLGQCGHSEAVSGRLVATFRDEEDDCGCFFFSVAETEEEATRG